MTLGDLIYAAFVVSVIWFAIWLMFIYKGD